MGLDDWIFEVQSSLIIMIIDLSAFIILNAITLPLTKKEGLIDLNKIKFGF